MKLVPEDVEQFRVLVERHLGMVFDDSKLELLEDVLRQCCEGRGLAPAAFLPWFAEQGSEEIVEVGSIARALTVGETYFCRNREQFSVLTEVVLPARLRVNRPVRVLSAGCASGEEPYTIAMALRESGIDPSAVAIRAVDVNPDALQKARRGRYTPWALRETPVALQRAWFRSEGRELVLDEDLRASVQFEQRNLVADDPDLWAPGSYDVVFCRNVIMYFAPETMKQVIARVARALRPGGYLFLGHAETLRGLSSEFHLHHTHGAFYYQRRADHERAEASGERGLAGAAADPSLTAVVDTSDSWVDAIQAASERIRALTAEPPELVPTSAPKRRWDLGGALELLRDERFTDALRVIERLPPEAARDPDVVLMHAVLLAHSGQFAAGERACRALLEIDELNAGAHYVLALCREGMGDVAGAMEQDQMAVYLDPTFAMARLHIGLLARRTGDRESARRELGQAALLLEREDASRLLLFGGGFQRGALISLCRSGLGAVETSA